jgi:hypothetical protein
MFDCAFAWFIRQGNKIKLNFKYKIKLNFKYKIKLNLAWTSKIFEEYSWVLSICFYTRYYRVLGLHLL